MELTVKFEVLTAVTLNIRASFDVFAALYLRIP